MCEAACGECAEEWSRSVKLEIITPAYLNAWELYLSRVKGLIDEARAEYQRIIKQQAVLAGFVEVK